MKFTYREIPILFSPATKRKKFIYRPILPVIIIHGKKFVGYEALVDSGADYNIFHSRIAEILGISLTKGHKRRILGIGNQELRGYEHDVTIKIAGREYVSKVIFSNKIPPNSFGILGNQGFFDHFKVTFKYPKYIELI